MPHDTPTAERRRLVGRWRQSHKTIAAFAVSVGIPTSTFSSWTRKYPPDVTAVVTTPPFVDVTPAPVPVPAPVQTSIRVAMKGHSVLELTFDALPEPVWLATMLREVSAC